MKEHRALRPQFFKPVVSCRFFFWELILIRLKPKMANNLSVYDWLEDKRKYTFKTKDEYDEEFGILLELGIYNIEEYFYIKGYHLGQQAFQNFI